MTLYEEIVFNINKQNYKWQDISKITTTEPHVIDFENEGVLIETKQIFKNINLDNVSINSLIMRIDMKDGAWFSLLNYDYGYHKSMRKSTFFQKILNKSFQNEIEFNNMVISELESSYRYLKSNNITGSTINLKNALNLLTLKNTDLYKKL